MQSYFTDWQHSEYLMEYFMGVFNKLITCDTAQPLYVQSFTGYFTINISSYVSELVRKFLVLPVN